jgi:hypothetical protein
MKIAIIILSDPRSGDEALGRTFNALAVAQEALQRSDQIEIVFNGAGTRWPEELAKLSHPANALYNSVRNAVKGASCGCAAVFGATNGLEACGVPLLKDKALAGTPGISDIRRYIADGWQTLIF